MTDHCTRQGLRPVSPKTLISLRVDADVLAWFKAQGAGYQTRMNAVLRAFKEAVSWRGGLEIPPRQRGERSLAVDGAEPTEAKAEEVLVLDSSTFIQEIGLTSKGASALKHYLYRRGTQLVVPQVVAEECEHNLTTIVRGKKEKIEEQWRWLGRFFGGVSGWPGPSDDAIEERAKVLAHAEHLGAIVSPETEIIRERAEARNRAERPPSHKKKPKEQLNDCIIWEHCLALLADHDVVFVSGDGDFCGHRRPDELHPQLKAEAEEVGAGRSLTFHPDMASLLSEFRAEKPSIPKEAIFAFVYDELAADIKELETNSGCRPTKTGDVKQTLLTTDQANILEVRLEVDDQWESPDGTKVHDFQLRGSCHYRLKDKQLCDLTVSSSRLLTTEPDGSVRAVKGSHINLAATFHAGAPLIKPKPEILE